MDDFDMLLGDPLSLDNFDVLLGPVGPANPRFVLFASYGNDSIALLQWAHENQLEDVAVVYSDTQWAARDWNARVLEKEAWVRGLGFRAYRTTSIGFADLARKKQGFPTQKFQWCSYILKIEPGERWLAENDADRRAVCLVGVRREESQDRANFPEYLPKSNSHGGRFMLAPLANYTEEMRDELLKRAGVEPLPHRSKECFPCVNSNKRDLQELAKDEARVAEVEALEVEMGITGHLSKNGKVRGALFRPTRHMGAVGIREVVKWAQSPRGKYVPPSGVVLEPDEFDLLIDAEPATCEAGWCGT